MLYFWVVSFLFRGVKQIVKVCGLQKLSMVDYPGTLAATVFTGGCNFRCPFCHNAPLVVHPETEREIPPEEVLRFLEGRKGILKGVVISGGEPLIYDDIDLLIEEVKALGFLVKLDTNGSFPERLERILKKGIVDYVAMDIKNSKRGYSRTIGVRGYDISEVERSVELLKSGTVPYEFRMTLVRELHTEDDIAEVGEWLSGAEVLYLQHFVDSGDLVGEGFSAFSLEETEKFAEILRKSIKTVEIRGL